MNNVDETKPIRQVPALVRAKRILDIVCSSDQKLTVSDIARLLRMPKSTAHGLCVTLIELGLLQKRDGHGLRIGPNVMRWANSFSREVDVADEFRAIWDETTDLPGATITLSVMNGVDVIYVAARNSKNHPSFFEFTIGKRLPAAFTATGKAFLMQMPDAEIRRLFKTKFPEPMTRKSVRNVDDLIREVQKCRNLGLAIDDEEVSEGMRCYGTTVHNDKNEPIAGIAVSLPAEQSPAIGENRIIETLTFVARRISQRLGADLSSLHRL